MASLPRNASAQVLLAEMGKSIAQFHKAEAARLLAESKIKEPSTFYWRGRRGGSVRQASSIQVIPDLALAKVPATIAFIDKAGSNIAVEVAVAAASLWKRTAPVVSGLLAGSATFLLNGKTVPLSKLVRIGESGKLTSKERIVMAIAAPYASAVEVSYWQRASKGLLLKVARELQSTFGARASIAFGYLSGNDIGAGFPWAVPVLFIGGPGAFKSTNRTPGSSRRRKARAARKNAKAS